MVRDEVDRRKASKAKPAESAVKIMPSDDETWRLRLRRICINYCHITDNAPMKDMLQHAWEEGTKLESMDTLQRVYLMVTTGAPIHSVLDNIIAAQASCNEP
jgi:hypothetical protein